MFLSVERFSLSGTTPVAVVNSFLNDDGVTTAACATLRNDPKSPAAPAPNSLDNVVIRSYTVSFGRPDGGDVPGPFTFNTAVLVPAGTAGDTATLVVVLVPAQAKREPPLRPFPQLPLFATANVVFEGRDGRGQRVETEGAVSVVFQADGTDTVPTC